MNRNPFHSGKGLLPFEKFSGRSDLLGALERMIREDWFQYLVEGERGYGKTSVRVWLNERYANDPSVLICPLDLGNFRPCGDCSAYEELINRASTAFRQSLSHKDRGAEILMKIREIFTRLKYKIPLPLLSEAIEIPQIGLPEPKISEFLRIIYDTIGDTSVQSVVFIFDEISSRGGGDNADTERWAWQFCSDFVSQLAQFDSASQDKRMGVILLTYPNDIYDVPIALAPDRHLTGRFCLRPFDLTEVQKLVEDLCQGAGIMFEDDFASVVYRLSGGSPDLVQSIGFGAFRRATHNNPDKAVVLTGTHALFAHTTHSAIIEKAMGLVRWMVPEIKAWVTGGDPETIAFRKALERMGELSMEHTHWHNREEWLEIGGGADPDAQNKLSAFIEASVERGLILVESHGKKLRFFGEILRHAVATIARA